MLAPFDDLNVVQKQVEKNGKGLEDDIWGDIGADLPQYDALAGLTDKLTKNMEKARENLKNMLPILGAIGVAFASWKIGKSVLGFLSSLNGTTGAIGGLTTLKKTLEKIKGIGFAGLLSKFATTLRKVSSVAIGLITTFMGANGVYNTMEKVGEGANFGAEAFALLTGNIAETVAGGALIGLRFGGWGALFGGIAGAVLSVVTAFKGWKDGVKELASSEVFGSLNMSTQQFLDMMNSTPSSLNDVNTVIQNYRGELQSLGTSFGENALAVDNYLGRMRLLGDEISGETGEKFKTSLDNLFIEANQIIDTGTQFSLDLWNTSFKDMTNVTSEEQANVLRIITENGAYVKTEMDNTQNRINEIWNNAMKTRGYLTEEEYKTIQDLLNKIRELTKGEMTKTQADVEYYKKHFSDKNNMLDQQSYKNYQEARKKYEEEQRAIILDSYETQYADAENNIRILQERMESANDDEKATLKEQIAELEGLQQDTYKTRISAEAELEKKLQEYDDDIYANLKQHYRLIEKATDDSSKEQRKIIENVFKDAKIDVSTLKSSFKSSGNMCAKQFAKGFNESQLDLKLSGNTDLGISPQKLQFRASAYAEGGFPKSGEFFMAREDGIPEMVGRIGNRSAVANNDQITTSLTNALITALSGFDFGGEKSPIHVYIGNKQVYEGYGDYAQSENDRYGTNMIRI